ncbi:uncharacterized protein METZ01_LOCUS478584, partial [marine metagenome]
PARSTHPFYWMSTAGLLSRVNVVTSMNTLPTPRAGLQYKTI